VHPTSYNTPMLVSEGEFKIFRPDREHPEGRGSLGEPPRRASFLGHRALTSDSIICSISCSTKRSKLRSRLCISV